MEAESGIELRFLRCMLTGVLPIDDLPWFVIGVCPFIQPVVGISYGSTVPGLVALLNL